MAGMLSQDISPELKAFAEREFVGEQMIWAEKPDQKIKAMLSFGIWLFAIPWTAFALFWESMVAGPLIMHWLGYEVAGKTPEGPMTYGMIAMGLFGIPFILVGFGMLLTPFWAMRKAGRTFYVLTNKRLSQLESGKYISITSIQPEEIVSTSRKEGPDGRGTLTVHMGFTRDSDGDRTARFTEIGVIHNVSKVEKLVLALKDRAKTT
ncbi:MAG: hypothetical protein ACRCWF_18530 [Beijerinckiaceae bacterium]